MSFSLLQSLLVRLHMCAAEVSSLASPELALQLLQRCLLCCGCKCKAGHAPVAQRGHLLLESSSIGAGAQSWLQFAPVLSNELHFVGCMQPRQLQVLVCGLLLLLQQ